MKKVSNKDFATQSTEKGLKSINSFSGQSLNQQQAHCVFGGETNPDRKYHRIGGFVLDLSGPE